MALTIKEQDIFYESFDPNREFEDTWKVFLDEVENREVWEVKKQDAMKAWDEWYSYALEQAAIDVSGRPDEDD